MPYIVQQIVRGIFSGVFALMSVWMPLQAAQTQEATATVPIVVELTSPAEELPTEAFDDLASVTTAQLSEREPARYNDGKRTRRAADLRRWHTLEVPAGKVPHVLEELQADPAVVDATPARVYRAAAVPNDSLFSEQYGLFSATQALADINAPEAWDVTTGLGSTVIAIVDGGVDLAHEDLADKAWVNAGEVAGNGVDDDGNGYIDDVHGWNFFDQEPAGRSNDHATHVAGIAAASSNNGRGVAGINWQAKIMSVRVLSSSGVGYEDDIVRGIEYAVANGADVINLSLVGPSSPALLAAVENAYAAGAVVVAAVGNQGRDTGNVPSYPACADVNGVDMVLGVAATDDEAEPWPQSNYGVCVNIAAPGYRIMSTEAGNDYGIMSGTSMSAPLVSGVAGLYLALHPGALPAEVITAIDVSAEAFVGDDATEWNENYKGILNAARVVGAGSAASPEPTPAPQPSSGGGGGGGGGDEPEPAPVKKPAILGTRTVAISAADRKAPDFIQNHTVPAAVAWLFQEVYGRSIAPIESTYWKLRARSDKATASKLRGAMQWQKVHGKTYDPKGLGAVAGATTKGVAAPRTAPPTLLQQINSIFRVVYGRTPLLTEHAYWYGRVARGEKTTVAALQGAMQWHRLQSN